MADMSTTEPALDCPHCPRLVAMRDDWRAREPNWFNGPVPTFGNLRTARLLIVGLAPGLRGANRTGRPFTGDHAGDLLYATMIEFGFARGTYDRRLDDGLTLIDTAITNAVRCVPPANKPIGEEMRNCRPYLERTLAAMPRLTSILALGRVAHDTLLSTLGQRRALWPFAHGARHDIDAIAVFDSYHCSRYNTNTGRLTTAMFGAVFEQISTHLKALSESEQQF
jgi:uracil-DNA glycosylase family 4